MEKICLQIHAQLVFSVEVFEGIEMVKQWVYYLLLKLFPKMMASSLFAKPFTWAFLCKICDFHSTCHSLPRLQWSMILTANI